MSFREIQRSWLKQRSFATPNAEADLPVFRQDTIHQVKGESIDSVPVVGSLKFWNAVVNAIESQKGSEERRLAYVAMTRARHQLIVSLPEKHFDMHVKKWISWGFEAYE